MNYEEFFFNHSKVKLFAHYWKPATSKAVVLLLHGMGEHSSRYNQYVIPELLQNSIGVLAFDNFGHGKSEGKRGHNPGYEAIMEVMDIMITKAKTIFGDLPIFLYGHSMGGNLVINYTLRNRSEISGTIATSPFLKLAFQPPGWKLFIGKLLQRLAPSITLPMELDVNQLSKDQEEVNKYRNDPLVHDKISPNFSFPIMEAGEWAIKNANLLTTPMLLIHGTEDKIIDHKGTIAFSEKTEKASLVLLDGGYHELHNDSEKVLLLDKSVAWIQSNI